MRNELNLSALNHEITTLLAESPGGKRLFMKANPVQGTMVFLVVDSGAQVCETRNLKMARDAYNDLGGGE